MYKRGMETTLTTQEAANRLGVTAIRVRQMIAAGRLPAQKFGRDYAIKESDLKLVEGRKVGRPPKAKTDTSKVGKKSSKR